MQIIEQDLLKDALRRFGKGMLFAAFLSFFINLLQLVVPLFTMQVYDRVLNSRSIDTLIMLVIVAIGALAVFALLDYIRARVYMVLSDSLSRRLNVPILQAAVSETLRDQGSNAAQTIRDVNELRQFVTGSAITVPLEALWVPVFLLVLFLLHPVYGVVALCSAVVLVGFSVAVELTTRRPLSEANEAAARSFNDVGAALRNAEAIEAMGMLPALARRWQHSQRRMLASFARGISNGRALAAASKATRFAMQIGIMASGVVLVIDREASPGSMIAASIIMGRMLYPFEQLIDGWRHWVFAFAAYGRVRDLLVRCAARPKGMVLPRPEGRLVVDRLSFIPPGQERPVLKGLSFTLEPGEALGVIGPSAAGKSTLARLLVGLWAPTTGGVYLDGHSVHLWERESFGRYVGYLPQSISLLDGTVRENIARLSDADPFDVVAAAKGADVHEMIGRLPHGYDTRIGDGGFALSGGQRQRIALARALFGMPRFLVLDEPNSNLDHIGERALLQAITEARQEGATIVVIAHRPSIVSVVDKLLVLKDGVVEQFGPRTDIIKSVTGSGIVAPKPAGHAIPPSGTVRLLQPRGGS